MPSDDSQFKSANEESVGLCATCRHAETIVSARGVTYYLCRLSFADSRFAKYPALPVLACMGYRDNSELGC